MRETPFDLLERELMAAAERQITAAAAPVPRRRSRRATALVLVAAAWAASSLFVSSVGGPVPYRNGPPVAGLGFGGVVPASVRLLTADVPDPDGGPPWGLRYYATTRQFGCLQVGRVFRGRLGVVGPRRTFHALRPGDLADEGADCVPLDGAGHAFHAEHVVAAAGGADPQCTYRREVQYCVGAVRIVDFGLLGPDATRVTYRAGGRSHTMSTLGAIGGYLIVQHRLTPVTRDVDGLVLQTESLVSFSPASHVITRVDYRDGTSCAAHATTSTLGSCGTPPGFVPIPQAKPGDVLARVVAFADPPRYSVHVAFRARQAVVDGRTGYDVEVTDPTFSCREQPRSPGAEVEPRGARCGNGGTGQEVDRNVAAGALVHVTVPVGLMHAGRYRVVVSLRSQPPRPYITGALAYPGVVVGRTSFVLKPRTHRP
jgi:hypothetical protein